MGAALGARVYFSGSLWYLFRFSGPADLLDAAQILSGYFEDPGEWVKSMSFLNCSAPWAGRPLAQSVSPWGESFYLGSYLRFAPARQPPLGPAHRSAGDYNATGVGSRQHVGSSGFRIDLENRRFGDGNEQGAEADLTMIR